MNQEQLISLIQAYAQSQGFDVNELIKDFEESDPEEQQMFIEEISSSFMQKGGKNSKRIPVSSKGYYELDPVKNPYALIPTPSGSITTKGINYDIAAYDGRTGDFLERMKPNREYSFDTDLVLEQPILAQSGGDVGKLIAEGKANLAKAKIPKGDTRRAAAMRDQLKNIEQMVQNLERFVKTAKIQEDKPAGVFSEMLEGVKNTFSPNNYNPKQYEQALNLLTEDLRKANNAFNSLSNPNIDLDEFANKTPKGFPSFPNKFANLMGEIPASLAKGIQGVDKFLTGDVAGGPVVYFQDEGTGKLEAAKIPQGTSSSPVAPVSTSPVKGSGKKSGIASKSSAPAPVSVSAPLMTMVGTTVDEYFDYQGRMAPIDPLVNKNLENRRLEINDPADRIKSEIEESVTSADSTNSSLSPISFKSNNFLRNALLGSRLTAAYEPIAAPYRADIEVMTAYQPEISVEPLVSSVENQLRLASVNINPNSTTGAAYLSGIQANAQQKLQEGLNQIAVQNQQIGAQNRAAEINAYNQERALQQQADSGYYENILQNEAVRDRNIAQAQNDVIAASDAATARSNQITGLELTTPGLTRNTGVVDRLLGNETFAFDKAAFKLSAPTVATPKSEGEVYIEAGKVYKMINGKSVEQSLASVQAKSGGKINKMIKDKLKMKTLY